MQTIQPVKIEKIDGATRRILETGNAERGAISNMVRTMAQSPHSLDGYWQLSRALTAGKLRPKLREQIALVVAQANHCEYSLAQHTSQASQVGLSTEEIVGSRWAQTNDSKTNRALEFARELATRRPDISILTLRDAGFDSEEIVEIVANVALNSFENHFNDVAQTDLDFPRVPLESRAAA